MSRGSFKEKWTSLRENTASKRLGGSSGIFAGSETWKWQLNKPKMEADVNPDSNHFFFFCSSTLWPPVTTQQYPTWLVPQSDFIVHLWLPSLVTHGMCQPSLLTLVFVMCVPRVDIHGDVCMSMSRWLIFYTLFVTVFQDKWELFRTRANTQTITAGCYAVKINVYGCLEMMSYEPELLSVQSVPCL